MTKPFKIDSGELTEDPGGRLSSLPMPQTLFAPTSPKPPGASTLLVVGRTIGNLAGDLQVVRNMAKCALVDRREINVTEIATDSHRDRS